MKKITIAILIMTLNIIVFGCATSGPKKVIVDTSGKKPDWVDYEVMKWEKDGIIYYKSKQTVRGDQRASGCCTIASNDNREKLLKGIYDEMRGATDEVQADLNEQAELILNKVRSGKWSGRIYGMSDQSMYTERYDVCEKKTGCVERIDCWMLATISRSDYERTRAEVINAILAVDPRVKEAITQKNIRFFNDQEKPAQSQKNPETTDPSPEITQEDIQ